jgi:membrane protease YdiL (CAAX protease family)
MYLPLNIWLTILLLAILLVWQWYDKRFFKGQYPFFAVSGLSHAQQGFVAAGLFSTVTFLIASLMGGFSWVPNREAFTIWETPVEIAVNAVLEELIFRGLILTLLWRFMKPFWAMTIHAILFAVYHWFLLDLFWDVPMMARFFAYALAWGMILGLAYTKTGSLWTPIAIHVGWNIMEGWVFGDAVINVFNAQYPADVEPLSGWKSVLAYNISFLVYFIIFVSSRLIRPSKLPRRVLKTEW